MKRLSAGERAGDRPSRTPPPPEDEEAATLFTIGAENLLVARSRQLQVALSFGLDGQYPVTLRLLLPPPPGAAHDVPGDPSAAAEGKRGFVRQRQGTTGSLTRWMDEKWHRKN